MFLFVFVCAFSNLVEYHFCLPTYVPMFLLGTYPVYLFVYEYLAAYIACKNLAAFKIFLVHELLAARMYFLFRIYSSARMFLVYDMWICAYIYMGLPLLNSSVLADSCWSPADTAGRR